MPLTVQLQQGNDHEVKHSNRKFTADEGQGEREPNVEVFVVVILGLIGSDGVLAAPLLFTSTKLRPAVGVGLRQRRQPLLRGGTRGDLQGRADGDVVVGHRGSAAHADGCGFG